MYFIGTTLKSFRILLVEDNFEQMPLYKSILTIFRNKIVKTEIYIILNYIEDRNNHLLQKAKYKIHISQDGLEF